MHCYQNWTYLDTTPNTNTLWQQLQLSCHIHKDHHKNVHPEDMHLIHESQNHGEIFFDWATLFLLILGGFCIVYIISWLLQLNVSWCEQILLTTAMGFIFGIVWNTIHPIIHSKTENNSTLNYGPPTIPLKKINDDGIFKQNHVIHHKIKDDRKGNFNVVFLGADELFNTNRIHIPF